MEELVSLKCVFYTMWSIDRMQFPSNSIVFLISVFACLLYIEIEAGSVAQWWKASLACLRP
jgi:hypothetical protein